jgi:hypothetical protein
MRSATYLYGFVRPTSGLPEGLTGIEEVPVRPIAIGGLAAVVGDVPAEPFESEAPSDPAWLIPRALQHERVIEAMRHSGPVMPVRFGSLFTTRRALEDWATENLESIGDFLRRAAGKDEWTIRLSLDLGQAMEALARVDADWAARVRALPGSPGARYLREKRLAEEAQREARRRSREVAAAVRAAARGLADERLLALRKPEAAGIEPVLNAAYHVPRADAGAFCERAMSAASGLPCLRPEFSGPWAASHFCPPLSARGR